MEPRRSFGRKITASSAHVMPQTPALAVWNDAVSAPTSSESAPISIEDEIQAWKSERATLHRFPWRQFSLMAGLCFGVASFVLPEAVNSAVQWPLYALTAISLYAGLHKSKNKSG